MYMGDLDVSTEDKFLANYFNFEDENNQLTRSLITMQNQLSKDEVRITASIIHKLGEALNKIYDFNRIIVIKKSCNDNSTINDLSILNMKIRNDNTSLFQKLDVAINSISNEELVTQLRLSFENIKMLFNSTVVKDFELENYF